MGKNCARGLEYGPRPKGKRSAIFSQKCLITITHEQYIICRILVAAKHI